MADLRSRNAELAPPLDGDQVEYLRAVYAIFHTEARWPTLKELHRKLSQGPNPAVARAVERIPMELLITHVNGEGGVALRLKGINVAVGQCEETGDFLSVVRLAADWCKDSSRPARITVGDLGALGLVGDRLRKFDMLREHVDFLLGPLEDPARGVYYEISEGIDAFFGIATVDEFLLAYEARRGATAVHGAGVGSGARQQSNRRVFVVHGRNTAAWRVVVELLNAFGLVPVLFRDVIPEAGKATPYVGDVLEKGFETTYASVIVMTPDDEARLMPDLQRAEDPHFEKELTGQARPNVLFEAGMGWSAHKGRSVILHLGTLRPLTDLEGLHVVRFKDDPLARQELGRKLEAAGCPVDWSGDWATAGDFSKLGDRTGTGGLAFDFDPTDIRFAVDHWADGPHRLFGRRYRVGLRNVSGRSIDGVRLQLKDVREQPYRPVYLRLVDDDPPYTASKQGVRLDDTDTALFDVVFFNHENPREEIQFFYATSREPNLRPPSSYTLTLVGQARDQAPITRTFRAWVEPGFGLRFEVRDPAGESLTAD